MKELSFRLRRTFVGQRGRRPLIGRHPHKGTMATSSYAAPAKPLSSTVIAVALSSDESDGLPFASGVGGGYSRGGYPPP